MASHVQFGINVNSHPQAAQGRPNSPSVLQGLTWARMVFFFHDAVDSANTSVNLFNNDWNKAFAYYDGLVSAYKQAGIRTLFVLNQQTFAGNAPWYPGSDGNWNTFAANFGAACGQIAAHFKGQGIAYEIWNEGDVKGANSSVYVDPATFANVLHSAYQQIKAQDSSAPVVFGGLATGAPSSIAYVKAVRAALGGTLPADAVGIHPYGQYVNARPNLATGWFGNLDQDTLALYTAQLGGAQTWITEIGVSQPGQIKPTDYPEVARYLADVFNLVDQKYAATNPVLIWFAWSDLLREAGIVDLSGNPKQPIYDTYLNLVKVTTQPPLPIPAPQPPPQQPTQPPAYTSPDASNPLVTLALALTAAFEGGYASYQNYDNGIVSYGRFQATLASGNLGNLVDTYLSQSQSATAQALRAYQSRIDAKDPTLRSDATLKTLLQQAAQESVMQAAQDQYGYNLWDQVQTLTVQPRGIQTPLARAMLYDIANQHGLHNQLVVESEDDLHVPERSVVGQNGTTEAQLILRIAQRRLGVLQTIATQQNLPGVLTRANFWLTLIQNGDWNLNGDASGTINANGTHLKGLPGGTASAQGVDPIGTTPPQPFVNPTPDGTPTQPPPQPTPQPPPITSYQLEVPWVSQLDGAAAKIGNDCGQSCVLMLLQYYNHVDASITVATLYDRAEFRNANGTTGADQLVALAAAFKLPGLTKFATNGSLQQVYTEIQRNRPVIVFVNYADLGFPAHLNTVDQGLHWLVATGYDQNGFYVNDPLWMGVQRGGEGGKKLPITEAQLTKAHQNGGVGNLYIVY